jgi:hypothetical protein
MMNCVDVAQPALQRRPAAPSAGWYRRDVGGRTLSAGG